MRWQLGDTVDFCNEWLCYRPYECMHGFLRDRSHLVAVVAARRTGKILFNHPEGTHDDRFWALALAVYAAEMAPPPTSKPLAKSI